jgi:hypothetical protein
MHFKNRDIYHGQFCNDKRTGAGVFASAGGDMYVGGFNDDVRQGHGVYCWYNGDVLEGTFVDGEVFGQATLTSKRSNFRYDGTFKDHKMHKGKMTYSDGSVLKLDRNAFQTSSIPTTSDRMSSVHEGLLLPEEELHMPKAVSRHDGSQVKETGPLTGAKVSGKLAKRGLFQGQKRAGEHGEEDTIVAKKPRREKTIASPFENENSGKDMLTAAIGQTSEVAAAAELIERTPTMPLGTQLQVDSMYSASSAVTDSESAYTESQSDRIAPNQEILHPTMMIAVQAGRAANQDSMSIKTQSDTDSETCSRSQLKLPPVRDILP